MSGREVVRGEVLWRRFLDAKEDAPACWRQIPAQCVVDGIAAGQQPKPNHDKSAI